jgi:hypothetical protein
MIPGAHSSNVPGRSGSGCHGKTLAVSIFPGLLRRTQERVCCPQHNEAFSFQVATDDQAETDRLWNAIVGNGGQESACGWCKDKWGLSWQITPRALTAAISDPDRAAAKRAFDAMMEMGKIDIATIEAARKG